MNQYKYILEKGSRKHICPRCNKKRFVKYIDTDTGLYVGNEFGRCDRENNCQYHNIPKLSNQTGLSTNYIFVPFIDITDYSEKAIQIKQSYNGKVTRRFIPKSTIHKITDSGIYVSEHFLINNNDKGEFKIHFISSDLISLNNGNGNIYQSNFKPAQIQREQVKHEYFNSDVFRKTLNNYDKNDFIQNLLKNVPYPFSVSDIEKVIELYRLGTYPINRAITFPYIDIDQNIHSIQLKTFDKQNNTLKTNWLHSTLYKSYKLKNKPIPDWITKYYESGKEFGIVNCLFGEYLLKQYPNNPVALVEAPKTAIYGTLYFGLPENPDNLIWLAVFNKSSFNLKKLEVLQGRKVVVFPDLSKDGSTFNEWEQKAKEIGNNLPNTLFIFSDLLENLAPAKDREAGNDIADYLIQLDWRDFRKKQQPTTPAPIPERIEQPPIDDVLDLSDLANKLIGKHNSEYKNPLMDKIMDLTGANEFKSNNILNMMMEQQIIDVDMFGQYYLYYSTPF